jgi:hypothetical protein
MPVVLVYYPGHHLATAVKFNNPNTTIICLSQEKEKDRHDSDAIRDKCGNGSYKCKK